MDRGELKKKRGKVLVSRGLCIGMESFKVKAVALYWSGIFQGQGCGIGMESSKVKAVAMCRN